MSTELAQKQMTPMDLMQLAIDKAGSIDVIERLAKLQYDMQDREARIGFDEALSRCQGQMKRISADMTNPQTHSKYASYATLDRAIRPIYIEEGFSISFGEDEGSTADYIVMLAYLSRGGYTRVYRKGMPIDAKGPKGNDVMTKTHAAGSADSYAKRYLLKDIFNLAIGEDDDDGNGGGGISNNQAITAIEAIRAQESPEAVMGAWKHAIDLAKSMKSIDYKAMTIFTEARDEKLKELRKAK
jgi:hypothetical protein